MKAIFNILVCMLLFVSSVGATNYYIAANGNDANTGTSMLAPWKTIDKVNSMMLVITAGDSILFRCNDVFVGQMNLTKSGSLTKKIVVTSYGVGNRPIINGAVNVTGWSASGITNVWMANYTGNLSGFRYLTANDVIQPIGRYPNTTAANDGFLYHDESWDNYQLRDAANLSIKINWTGATVVVYSTPYSIDICSIARHLNDTFTLAQPTFYNMYSGYGYFIQNHLSTLDAQGEWYADTVQKKIYYYSTQQPSNILIQASAFNHAIKCNDKISDVVINNLYFKNTDSSAIAFKSANRITISNCQFYNCLNGIRGELSTEIGVQNCLFNYLHNNAIWMANLNSNITVTNNVITNHALISGLGAGGGSGNNNAISVLGTNSIIANNTINKCGYIGIRVEGYNGLIAENRINEFNVRQFDGAAIYSFGTTSSVAGQGRLYGENKIEKNNISNGVGYRKGTSSGDGINRQPGIYMDFYTTGNAISKNILYNTNGILLNNGSNNHRVMGNTLYNADSFNLAHPDIACIHINEGSSNHTVVSNTLYNMSQKINLDPYSVIVLDRRTGQGLDSLLPFENRNHKVAKNLFFSSQNIRHLPISANYGYMKYPHLFATLDSNYYWQPFALDSFVASVVDSGYTKIKETSFGAYQWQKKVEPNAQFQVADSAFQFSYGSVVRNIFATNTTFNTNLSGWSFDGENASNPVTWAASGGLDAGCAQLSLANASANGNLLSSARLSRTIGAVAAGDVFRLKFSMIANSNTGEINIYTIGANSTTKTYTTSTVRKNYEIPICFSNAANTNTLFFSIHTKGLKVFLDNIVLEKVTVNQTSPDSVVHFFVNESSQVKSFNLGKGIYKDFFGATYADTVQVAPYASTILLKTAAIPLPFHLIDFRLHTQNDIRTINWITASELNVASYWLETSVDGTTFQSMQQVQPQWKNYNVYQLRETSAINVKYYRLKIQHDDGNITYSRAIRAVDTTPHLSMQLLNTNGQSTQPINLLIQSNRSVRGRLVGYAISGQELFRQTYQIQMGINYLQIAQFHRAATFLVLTTEDGQSVIKKNL